MSTADYPEILARAEKLSEKCCRQYQADPRLWEDHVRLVREFALRLAEIEGADQEVVELAALLHDIGKFMGRENHHEYGYEIARAFLEPTSLPEAKKLLILKCILKHRTRFAAEENELEVKVIQSADVLGTLFDDTWQDYSRRTICQEEMRQLYLKAMQKINLESARKLAQPKIEELERLLVIPPDNHPR
jgi:putative nucleotidyltransferase with HDIG domain